MASMMMKVSLFLHLITVSIHLIFTFSYCFSIHDFVQLSFAKVIVPARLFASKTSIEMSFVHLVSQTGS